MTWTIVVTLLTLGATPAADREDELTRKSGFTTKLECQRSVDTITASMAAVGLAGNPQRRRGSAARNGLQTIVASCTPRGQLEGFTQTSTRRRT